MSIEQTVFNLEIFNSFGAYILLVLILFPGFMVVKIIGNRYSNPLFSIIKQSVKKQGGIGKKEKIILDIVAYLIFGVILLFFIVSLVYFLSTIIPSLNNTKKPGSGYEVLSLISSIEYTAIVLLYIRKKSKINFVIDFTVCLLVISNLLKFAIIENITNPAILIPVFLIILDEEISQVIRTVKMIRKVNMSYLISKKLPDVIRKDNFILILKNYAGLFRKKLCRIKFRKKLYRWLQVWLPEFGGGITLITAISMIFYIYLAFQPFSPNIDIRQSFENTSTINVKTFDLYVFNNGESPVFITEIRVKDGLINNSSPFILPTSQILAGHNYTTFNLNYTQQVENTNFDTIEIVGSANLPKSFKIVWN
ncbi:MAG: hypothetical protein NTY73_04120 [Candidatus Micrarchaeota archaeon]|nr:hypothetical protein [Candidatus Micrarchaeota archaeon]